MESYLNPNNNDFIEMFAISGIKTIIRCYEDIVANGQDRRFALGEDFLRASSVSYTHLDVYKRQSLACRERERCSGFKQSYSMA